MPNENEFLETVAREGEPLTEKETPAESTPANEPEKDKPAEGENTSDENVPFHKHPRWMEREEELKALRESNEATARELAELKTIAEETSKRLPTDTSIPEWFKELYGENATAWAKYSEHDQKQREEIKREVIEEQQKAAQQTTQEAAKWNKWVDDEIQKLKAEGHQFDRNEFIKTMLDFRPTDETGSFDFKKGITIYEALKAKGEDPAKSHARKELADTMTKSSGSGDKALKDYQTSADLRHRSWANL